MKKAPIYFPFLLALFMLFFGTVLFPHIRLMAFAPFLAIIYNRTTFVKALWWACLCGLILDLISSELRFGLQALGYCLTTVFLYHQKKHFFEDKATSLCFFTALISALATLTHLALMHIFGQEIAVAAQTFLTDVVIMSALDGVYAFLWFICPLRLYTYIQRVGWKVLFTKKKEDEQQ